jgi:serine/tyrosine/threonine adenylyltransferase
LTYTSLPSIFHSEARLDARFNLEPILLNHALAQSLGIGATNRIREEGVAQAYAGHQYGHFTMLGDGRAMLAEEIIDPSGQRFDLHYKGSGSTEYSRRGDGLAALGPMLREYLISEALHAFGIPTTRSLAVYRTGIEVFRETILPGALLVRVAASHLRVGTFQFARVFGSIEDLRALADYAIERHFPSLTGNRYLRLLDAVIERQAKLIAQSMGIGFIHGVMNTDNMTISGESIDFGPCAFMDHFDPSTVFSSIDRNGRYAYFNQPAIAQWNLARLADALLPLIDSDEASALELASDSIHRFRKLYEAEWDATLRKKLGLTSHLEGDVELMEEWLSLLESTRFDFTNAYCSITMSQAPSDDFGAWFSKWKSRGNLDVASMRKSNPVRIPRNHLVEAALISATGGDFSDFHNLLRSVQSPFEDRDEFERFKIPPIEGEEVLATFCGT